MADKNETIKTTRKRIYRKLDKDLEGFYSTNNRTMRTPVNLYDTKPLSKGSQKHGRHHEDSYNLGFWETKRSSRRHLSEGDFRSNYGPRSKGGDKGKLDHYSSAIDDESAGDGSMIAPVILTRERSSRKEDLTPNKNTLGTATSEVKVEPEIPKKEITVTARPQQTPPKMINTEVFIQPDVVMASPLKLIDEALYLSESLSPYLVDQSNFLVVAVIGFQGSGKSTIASLLAEPSAVEKFGKNTSQLFQSQSREEILSGCHATSGVDIFITKERLFILDFQPLLSPSVMDYSPNIERKAILEYVTSPEHHIEVESLQLLTFAMTIAHAVVVVHSNSVQLNLTQMLHTCQMVKPHSNTSSSGLAGHGNRLTENINEQYFPHVIMIQNMASDVDMTPKSIGDMQAFHQATLFDSSLCFESQIGVCIGTNPPLSTKNGASSANFYIVREAKEDNADLLLEEIWEIRRQILGLHRCPLTHLTLTEKSWYAYTCRVWESLRKSSLFAEYSRLLS